MTITTQAGELAMATQYAKYNDGHASNLKSINTVTITATVADGNTVVVNGVTYTAKTTLTPTAGQFLIGSSTTDTAQNLAYAINGTLSANVAVGTTPNLYAWADPAANLVYLHAFSPDKAVGNALTLAKTGANISITGATFAGGITGNEDLTLGNKAYGIATFVGQPSAADTFVIDTQTYKFVSGTPAAYSANTIEVKIGATVPATTLRLVEAILQSGVAGTDYSTGASANPSVTVESYTDTAVYLRALTAGTAGNSVVLTKSGTNLAVTGSGTLKDGAALSTFQYTNLTWWRFPARAIDYSEVQMQDVLPLEIGLTMTPKGAYKQGVAVGGGASIIPRLQDSIGTVLLAALGSASTSASGGVGTHTFTFQSQEINIPWLAMRKMIPGRDDILGQGIIGFDNKINVLRTTIAATAPVEMLVQAVGRVPVPDSHPEVWTGQVYEDFVGVPLACKAHFQLPTVPGLPVPLRVTQVVVQMANVTTTPREEMIVGSYFPDDVVPRTRAMTIQFIYKWRDAKLWQYLFGNALSPAAWSPTPFRTITSGGNKAVDILVQSPFNITGTQTPYSLGITANEVFWQVDPIGLQAGNLVMMNVTGTVLYNTSGYVQFVLTNGNTTGYSVPAEA